MKKLIIAAAIAMFATPSFADGSFGKWKTEVGETGGYLEVKIGACGSKICGTILKVIGNENKTPEGRQIIMKMNADGGGKYSGGKIWAPDTDKTYKSTMQLLNKNSLKVSGHFLIITRTQTWTRIK